MELAVLYQRVLSGISTEQFNQEYFYLNIPQYKLKTILGYHCGKDILDGKSCLNCTYNLYPERTTGTACGILKHILSGKVSGSIFINHPHKSICEFCKMR